MITGVHNIELIIDSKGYPDDGMLDAIRVAEAIGEGAAQWLQWALTTFAELVPYASCEVEGAKNTLSEPVTRITFHTGGRSGAEDFIAAILGNAMLNGMYYTAWRRGGHFTFEVPA